MPDQQSQRQRLLDHAADAFARHGYDGASVRTIAQAASINGAMVAYYFDSKEGLFRAVLEDRDAQIRQRLAWAEKSAGPGQPRGEARHRAYLQCVLVEFPEFLHIALSHALLAGDTFPNDVCRSLLTNHTTLLGTPDLPNAVTAELITAPTPLMEQTESERQALADKLSTTPKRRKPSRAIASPPPAAVRTPIAATPEPTPPTPQTTGDDFLDGFLD